VINLLMLSAAALFLTAATAAATTDTSDKAATGVTGATAVTAPVVELPRLGTVNGVAASNAAGRFWSFRGIPYAGA
jgi:hypothetical protein